MQLQFIDNRKMSNPLRVSLQSPLLSSLTDFTLSSLCSLVDLDAFYRNQLVLQKVHQPSPRSCVNEHTQSPRYLFTDDHISIASIICNLWEFPAVSYATLSQVYFSVKKEFLKSLGMIFFPEVTCHSHFENWPGH